VQIVSPESLQAALTLAYHHKNRTRWLVGKSELLNLDYSKVPRDAFIIDARSIAEFRAVERFHDRLWGVGVFASITAIGDHSEIGRQLVGETAMPLLRLLGLEAKLVIGLPGTTRTAPLASIYGDGRLRIAPHEVPIALEVPKHPPHLAFAERRRLTSDGEASYDLRLLVCLKVGALGAIDSIRIAVALDDGPPQLARQAEERLMGRKVEGRRAESEVFGEAARLAAQTFPSTDAKSSAAARALPALMLSAIKEAHALARCA
jgi:CO/xanthine dehydrogenase FAD-binding subunit